MVILALFLFLKQKMKKPLSFLKKQTPYLKILMPQTTQVVGMERYVWDTPAQEHYLHTFGAKTCMGGAMGLKRMLSKVHERAVFWSPDCTTGSSPLPKGFN